MTVLKLLSFLSVLFLSYPVSNVLAQDEQDVGPALSLDEAKDLINSSPTAADAVKGVVPTETVGVYDIYSRQLSYRENVKELRASLEQRRENFKKPRSEILANHRDMVEKVYAAETSAYIKDTESSGEDVEDAKSPVMDKMDMPNDKIEGEDMASSDVDGPDLKEMPIPDEGPDEGGIKRKVITTDDAPDFDPAAL